MKVNLYYVYCYLDPRFPGDFSYGDDSFCISFSYKPIYIGKGSGKRYLSHIQNKRIDNIIFKNTINKINKDLKRPPIVYKIQYFQNENDAYLFEEKLIALIGSCKSKEIIKNGSLLNLCPSSRPPSHKGKTYLDIYKNEGRAEEERKKRHENQLKKGGYFKGHKHSKETLKKIAMPGESNGMYGKHHRKESVEKIRKKAKDDYATGKRSAFRAIYLVFNTLENKSYYSYFGLSSFCSFFGLSSSTLQKSSRTKVLSQKGKTAGWYYEIVRTPIKYNEGEFYEFILNHNKGFLQKINPGIYENTNFK